MIQGGISYLYDRRGADRGTGGGAFQLCRAHHSQLHPLEVPDGLFTDAPVVRYYSRAMYYRLLAAELLPRELDRVLYLDPDILVIRPVRPLYETQLETACWRRPATAG